MAIAVLHALSPLLLLGVHFWFGYDETVYLSQLNAHVPPGLFSAPRARGATFLAAPVTLLTSSVDAVRLWVTTLSGVGLYLAFRPWLRLRSGYAVPLAALLFSTVWTTVYYGFEVMPNEWVAFGIVAACGHLLRYLDGDGGERDDGERDGGSGRGQLVGVAVAMAIAALLRPSDALCAAVPLVVGCAVVHGTVRRRAAAAGALVLGSVAGSLEWVIEAYVSFGGLGRRIALAQAEQGGSGLHFAGAAQARALAGPLLCRAGCHADAPLVFRLWWVVLVALVLAAVGTARRGGSVRLDVLPVAVGLALAAQYVFTVTYAAPRFLLPTYAALSLPAAAAALRIVHGVRGRRPRRALATAGVAVLVGHMAVQLDVLVRRVGPSATEGARVTAGEVRLMRHDGIGRPCLLLTDQNLAYAAGCTNTPRVPDAVRDELEDGTRVVWIRATRPSSRFYGVQWSRLELPGTAGTGQVAYVSGRFDPRVGADDPHTRPAALRPGG